MALFTQLVKRYLRRAGLVFASSHHAGARYLEDPPVNRYLVKYGWAGLMLEPLSNNFRSLKQNCGGRPNVRCRQAAVDSTAGRRLVYDLKFGLPGLPEWARGLGSFDRERLQQAIKELGLDESAIGVEEVDTITWDQVWADFGPAHCDLLLIDTEGHDIRLLRLADLGRHRPTVIHFEHGCVSLDERLDFYRELLLLGYELSTQETDTIAYLPNRATRPK